jgi:hypothetical protein
MISDYLLFKLPYWINKFTGGTWSQYTGSGYQCLFDGLGNQSSFQVDYATFGTGVQFYFDTSTWHMGLDLIIVQGYSTGYRTYTLTVLGSNDNTNWTNLGTMAVTGTHARFGNVTAGYRYLLVQFSNINNTSYPLHLLSVSLLTHRRGYVQYPAGVPAVWDTYKAWSFPDDLSITGKITSSTAICASVYYGADISIPTGVWTAVTFSNTLWDNVARGKSSHWSGASPTRLTVQTSGLYSITGNVSFNAAVTTGIRGIAIKINGVFIGVQLNHDGSASDISIATQWFCNPPDYIEMFVYQTSGANLNLLYRQWWSARLSIVRVP